MLGRFGSRLSPCLRGTDFYGDLREVSIASQRSRHRHSTGLISSTSRDILRGPGLLVFLRSHATRLS